SIAALAAIIAPLAQAAELQRPLALDAAASYREAARYPEWSRPVREGMPDPIVAQRTPTRQVLRGRQHSERQLAVWASGIAFEAGQNVDLYASLEDAAPRSLREELTRGQALTITATLVDEAGRTLSELDYADDGRGADALRGDGVYSARYRLAPEDAPAPGHAKSIMVKLRALAADGESFAGSGGFQYSSPGARLTGVFDNALRDGSLVLRAQAEVLAAGRYHLAATLSDLAGRPIAEAQSAHDLKPGVQEIELTFYGLALRERGAAGPLRVGSITLTSALGMPNALGPVLSNVALIPARPLSAYTDRAFGRPDLLEAAQRLEVDALQR
ncbi:MAG: hypothetical protein ACLGI7_07285, partial [Gammaproteobacteria bacterium]